MSQFLLLANPNVSRIPEWVQVNYVEGDPFFTRVARAVFSELDTPVVAIISAHGKDFDEVFVDAQRDLIDGKSLDGTLLYRIIMAIDGNVDSMALWYGSDYEGIEKVSNFQSVVNEIQRGLSAPSVEAYVLYVKS